MKISCLQDRKKILYIASECKLLPPFWEFGNTSSNKITHQFTFDSAILLHRRHFENTQPTVHEFIYSTVCNWKILAFSAEKNKEELFETTSSDFMGILLNEKSKTQKKYTLSQVSKRNKE